MQRGPITDRKFNEAINGVFRAQRNAQKKNLIDGTIGEQRQMNTQRTTNEIFGRSAERNGTFQDLSNVEDRVDEQTTDDSEDL